MSEKKKVTVLGLNLVNFLRKFEKAEVIFEYPFFPSYALVGFVFVFQDTTVRVSQIFPLESHPSRWKSSLSIINKRNLNQ